MNQLKAVERATRERNKLKRSGFISETFELTFRSSGREEANQRVTVILPASCKESLPEPNRHLPWSTLQSAVQAIKGQVENSPMDSREVLDLLDHWVRSPTVFGAVISRAVPAGGVDRLHVRYWLDDSSEAWSAIRTLGVLAKKTDRRLVLQLASQEVSVRTMRQGAMAVSLSICCRRITRVTRRARASSITLTGLSRLGALGLMRRLQG